MSSPICRNCNRLRLTASGEIRSCLLEVGGVDVKSILREGGFHAEIIAALRQAAAQKPETHRSIVESFHGSMSRIGG